LSNTYKLYYLYIIFYVYNYFISESSIPAKRTRRNMTPSPSTAEGQASKPESTAILSKIRNDKIICKVSFH
jgi:hypothetical protein